MISHQELLKELKKRGKPLPEMYKQLSDDQKAYVDLIEVIKHKKVRNPLLCADSYKYSHWLQYPPNSDGYFGYIEARKATKTIEPYTESLFFGLQMYVKDYLMHPITIENVEEAYEFSIEHGEPFNKKGWDYLVDEYNGYFPVTIRAVKEGTIVPEGNALVTVECLDPKLFWVGSFLETSLLRGIWYPTTVATNSFECKKLIYKYMLLSSDDPLGGMAFKLHDFGARGVSSGSSAELGGASHGVNFLGSDTVEGVKQLNDYYNKGKMSCFSIPAMEHSTVTAWGRENEASAYRNMLEKFAKPGAIIACVSDSYDIYNACEKLWGEELKNDVIKSGATIVIRPDSGDPPTTVTKCLRILDKKFGTTLNNKGYKVLNNVKVIQGDGINYFTIDDIFRMVIENGYSADNVNLGMGGALLQFLNRDTLRFAMKCSAVRINNKWRDDISKSPIGDLGKKSKEGRLSLYTKRNGHGTGIEYKTLKLSDDINKEYIDVMDIVYQNGKLMREQTLDEVRKLASL